MKLRLEAVGTSEPNQPQGLAVDVIMTPQEMAMLAAKLKAHAEQIGGPNAIQFQCGVAVLHFVRVEPKLVTLAAPGGLVKS